MAHLLDRLLLSNVEAQGEDAIERTIARLNWLLSQAERNGDHFRPAARRARLMLQAIGDR